jgi:hypothetical protein
MRFYPIRLLLEPEELGLVHLVQDRNHSPLDDFIFQRGDAKRSRSSSLVMY